MAAGVLMIAWPLYAAQRMNVAILSETIGMALRPHERAADEVITREEIAAVVSELMEGEKGGAVRGWASDLQKAAAQVWAPEGSSSGTLEELAAKWKAAAVARRKR
jgi:hydroquinone glucosyltransferase